MINKWMVQEILIEQTPHKIFVFNLVLGVLNFGFIRIYLLYMTK